MSAAIEITNLRKTYKGASKPSVDGLTLSIEKGAFFGLLGPNGAGKTTTIAILCGLLPFDSGTVRVGDFDIHEIQKIKPLIGVVPQDIAIYPELTVRENLQFFGRIQGLSERLLTERIDEFADSFGLTSHVSKKTAYLSGGMKRKVNLIVALLHHPQILFLDEPTVGVDVMSKQEIMASLQTLNCNGMTIVYTSHDMNEAEHLCNTVALMNHGKIVCNGKPAELMAKYGVDSLEKLFLLKTESA